MKKLTYVSILLLVLTAGMFAEGIDGIISPGEYPIEKDFGKMRFYARPEGDNLAVGLWAESKGWIAAGFGSLKMDGSAMVMGVGKKDGGEVKELTARGHRVRDAEVKRVIDWSILEENDQTVLEFLYPVSEFVSAGGLEMILAYSWSDATWMKHSFNTSLVLDLDQ